MSSMLFIKALLLSISDYKNETHTHAGRFATLFWLGRLDTTKLNHEWCTCSNDGICPYRPTRFDEHHGHSRWTFFSKKKEKKKTTTTTPRCIKHDGHRSWSHFPRKGRRRIRKRLTRVKRKKTRNPKGISVDNRATLHSITSKLNWAKVPLAQLLKRWKKDVKKTWFKTCLSPEHVLIDHWPASLPRNLFVPDWFVWITWSTSFAY